MQNSPHRNPPLQAAGKPVAEVSAGWRPFLELHASILLAGFTGLFGRWLPLNEGVLVCCRSGMTAGILLLVLTVTGRSPRLPVRDAVRIGAVGSLLAIHWVLFYGSIKASNVSIGVVSFSTIGFFSALLEPWFERSRPRWTNLGLSLLSLAGVALIFHFDFRYRTGILLGVACAVFAALFTILSKRETRRGAPEILLFWEMTGGTILLLPLLPLCLRIFPHAGAMGARELLLLFLLSSVFTVLLYLLQIRVLKSVSAFTVNLSYNLEPVYSILLAMLFFGEARELHGSFYAGILLILSSVLLLSLHEKKKNA